jgi:hypothetical protein
MTSTNRFNIIKDLRNMRSKVTKLKWSGRSAVDELIKYVDSYNIVKFKYNTIDKTSLTNTVIKFEKDTFMIHNLKSDKQNEEKLEIFDKDDDTEILKIYEYTCYYDTKLIKSKIKKNQFIHVTVDDYILFLTKISNSEYKLDYSQIKSMQEFE